MSAMFGLDHHSKSNKNWFYTYIYPRINTKTFTARKFLVYFSFECEFILVYIWFPLTTMQCLIKYLTVKEDAN